MGISINRFITAMFVLFMLISVAATAQVKRLSPSEGLSQSYVNTMLIDNNGYLWLSTEGGLNRYDGYQVIPINGPNGELEEAIIDRIYQDPEGQIWIASLLAGLFRYDPQTDTYQQYLKKPVTEEQILQQSVFTMLATDDKSLWVGQGRVFAKLDIASGSITPLFKLPKQFENAFVRTLFHYNGHIFIAVTAFTNCLTPVTISSSASTNSRWSAPSRI